MATEKKTKPSPKPKANELPWYAKALSIKNQPELAQQIETILAEIAEDARPKNAKEFLLYLLDGSKDTVSAQKIEYLEQKHAESRNFFQEKIKEYQEKTDSLLQENQGLRAEKQSLLEKTDSLQKENEGLQNRETSDADVLSFIKNLIPDLPAQVQTGEHAVRGLHFMAQEESKKNEELSQKVNELKAAFEEYKKKAPMLTPNEAVFTFDASQKENLNKARSILDLAKYRFRSDDPNDVVHGVIDHYLQTISSLTSVAAPFRGAEQIID